MGHVIMGDTQSAWLMQDGDRGLGFAMDGCNQRDGHNQRDRQVDTRGSTGHLLHQNQFL